jgi:hypothetical protein
MHCKIQVFENCSNGIYFVYSYEMTEIRFYPLTGIWLRQNKGEVHYPYTLCSDLQPYPGILVTGFR